MFEKVTIELNQADLKTLIQDRIRTEYGQECNVEFDVSMQCVGYGPSESTQPVFSGAKIHLVPKRTT